jgi:hypothetical protein
MSILTISGCGFIKNLSYCINYGSHNVAQAFQKEKIPSHLRVNLFAAPFLHRVRHGDGS